MKALVATDGSPASLEAARAARALLHRDVEFVVVTVVGPSRDPSGTVAALEAPPFNADEAVLWADEHTAAGRVALEYAAEAVGGEVETRIVEDGDAGRALCELAESTHADVLVIGSSPGGIVRHLLVGSVMARLVHHAPCPVLVVRHAD